MMRDRLGAHFAQPDLATLTAMILALPLGFDVPVPLKAISLLAAAAAVVWGGPAAGLSIVCVALSVSSFVVWIGGTEWSSAGAGATRMRRSIRSRGHAGPRSNAAAVVISAVDRPA